LRRTALHINPGINVQEDILHIDSEKALSPGETIILREGSGFAVSSRIRNAHDNDSMKGSPSFSLMR
jgi:hypothetical protein